MSKVIEIKNQIWTGHVIIYDRLVLSQVEAVENAIIDENERIIESADGKIRFTKLDKPKIPALIACVEKWEIKDFPETVTMDTFPLSPRREAHNLIQQIFDEIRKVYNGEIEVPNE